MNRKTTPILPLLALLGSCVWHNSYDANWTVDGVELAYERQVGLVLGDIEGAALRFTGDHADIEVVPVEGESRVIAVLREAFPRDGRLVFEAGELTVISTTERPVLPIRVRFEVGQQLGSIDFHTNLGDIDVRHVGVTNQVALQTNLGDIDAKQLGAVSRLTAFTDLGDVEVRGVEPAALEVDSGLGDVCLKDVVTVEATLRTDLGDVDVRGCRIEHLDAATGLGDIEGGSNQITSREVRTGLGDVDLD